MRESHFYKRFCFVTNLFAAIVLFVPVTICGQDDKRTQGKNQSQDEVFRVDSTFVNVPTIVFDREGRYVINLKKEDFQIFEDGVEQEIALFEPTEKTFTVLLLLDVSGSMYRDRANLAHSADAFLKQLRPDDQIIVASFDEYIDVLSEAAKVSDVRGNKKFNLRFTKTAPITMVYDGVDFALKKMKKIRGRKAIVLFSDALGSGYFASAKSTLRDAQENEALIYTVQFSNYPKIAPRQANEKEYYKDIETANNYMRDLAQATGGRHYQIENITDLESTFNAVAEELRRQYTLGYYPKQTTTGKKQIKVKVRQPNVVVRARDSYVVQSSKNK